MTTTSPNPSGGDVELKVNRPYFRHLPGWIYQHPAYTGAADDRRDRLTASECWALHMIAGQCTEDADGEGSVRGCWCRADLLKQARCSRSVFWRMLAKLRRLGFVVKLTQGGGNTRANELGIPGRAGALDALAVGDDARYRKPRQTVLIPDGKPCQSDTVQGADHVGQTVPIPDGKPSRSGRATVPIPDGKPSGSDTQSSSEILKKSSRDHRNGAQGARPETGEVPAADADGAEVLLADDDDRSGELRRLLPDGADASRVREVLIKAGVDGGRAFRLAHDPAMSPELARGALARAMQYRPGMHNPGAYVAGLIDDRLQAERDAARNREERRREAARSQQAEIEATFDDLTDAELQPVLERSRILRDAGFEVVRTDPALRMEAIKVLVRLRATENGATAREAVA